MFGLFDMSWWNEDQVPDGGYGAFARMEVFLSEELLIQDKHLLQDSAPVEWLIKRHSPESNPDLVPESPGGCVWSVS